MKKTLTELLQNSDWRGILKMYPAMAEKDAKTLVTNYNSVRSGAMSSSKAMDAISPISNRLEKSISGFSGTILRAFSSLTNTVSDGIQNIADGFDGNIKESIIDIHSTIGTFMKDLASLNPFRAIGDVFTGSVDTITKAIGNAYAAEAQGRISINKELNITGELADAYRDTMTDAWLKVKFMGGSFKDIQDIVQSVSSTLGRSRMLTTDTINDIFILQKELGLSSTAIGEAAGAMEDVSIGISSAGKQLQKSGDYARSIGLKVNDYITKLTQNLTIVNQYGFKNGIDGLTKMVAKAQSLRMEISTVTNLAEKVFNPEGAIEMAAQLQAIGGGFGSFADPLKLVYQATNDMEGLQDSLTEAAKSLTSFNAASGRFEITAVNMRRARDMATAMGMSYQDLTNLAVRAAQKTAILSKMDMFPNITDEQKQFLSNMAELKDGKIVVSLPDSISKDFGAAAKDGFLDVQQLSSKGIDTLREKLDQYERATKESPAVIASQQLTELAGIKNIAEQILQKMGVRAFRGLARDTGIQEKGREIVTENAKTNYYTDEGFKFVDSIGEKLKQVFVSPIETMKSIEKQSEEFFKKLMGSPQTTSDKSLDKLSDELARTYQQTPKVVPEKIVNTITEKEKEITTTTIKGEEQKERVVTVTAPTIHDDLSKMYLQNEDFIKEMKGEKKAITITPPPGKNAPDNDVAKKELLSSEFVAAMKKKEEKITPVVSEKETITNNNNTSKEVVTTIKEVPEQTKKTTPPKSEYAKKALQSPEFTKEMKGKSVKKPSTSKSTTEVKAPAPTVVKEKTIVAKETPKESVKPKEEKPKAPLVVKEKTIIPKEEKQQPLKPKEEKPKAPVATTKEKVIVPKETTKPEKKKEAGPTIKEQKPVAKETKEIKIKVEPQVPKKEIPKEQQKPVPKETSKEIKIKMEPQVPKKEIPKEQKAPVTTKKEEPKETKTEPQVTKKEVSIVSKKEEKKTIVEKKQPIIIHSEVKPEKKQKAPVAKQKIGEPKKSEPDKKQPTVLVKPSILPIPEKKPEPKKEIPLLKLPKDFIGPVKEKSIVPEKTTKAPPVLKEEPKVAKPSVEKIVDKKEPVKKVESVEKIKEVPVKQSTVIKEKVVPQVQKTQTFEKIKEVPAKQTPTKEKPQKPKETATKPKETTKLEKKKEEKPKTPVATTKEKIIVPKEGPKVEKQTTVVKEKTVMVKEPAKKIAGPPSPISIISAKPKEKPKAPVIGRTIAIAEKKQQAPVAVVTPKQSEAKKPQPTADTEKTQTSRQIDLNIKFTAPTMFDDLARKLLRDPEFIAQMKKAIETSFET